MSLIEPERHRCRARILTPIAITLTFPFARFCFALFPMRNSGVLCGFAQRAIRVLAPSNPRNFGNSTSIFSEITSGLSPSFHWIAIVRLYVSVPLPMETGMHAETLKNAKVAVFLNRSALCMLLLPAACLSWALPAYPPQDAFWFCFVLATFSWPFAGVLFIVSAGFQSGRRAERFEHDAGFREAHGH